MYKRQEMITEELNTTEAQKTVELSKADIGDIVQMGTYEQDGDPETEDPVSYTHLDVYKRQDVYTYGIIINKTPPIIPHTLLFSNELRMDKIISTIPKIIGKYT